MKVLSSLRNTYKITLWSWQWFTIFSTEDLTEDWESFDTSSKLKLKAWNLWQITRQGKVTSRISNASSASPISSTWTFSRKPGLEAILLINADNWNKQKITAYHYKNVGQRLEYSLYDTNRLCQHKLVYIFAHNHLHIYKMVFLKKRESKMFNL